jgi:competence protein ComEA
MRGRRSSFVNRFLGCFMAMVFLMTGFTWVVPAAHAQVQKSTVAPTKALPQSEAQAAPGKKATPAAKLAPGEKVNINSASKDKLEALPGIGPAKADAIIAGRPYAKTEDIMKVKGIKKGTYDKIKDLITVQ